MPSRPHVQVRDRRLVTGPGANQGGLTTDDRSSPAEVPRLMLVAHARLASARVPRPRAPQEASSARRARVARPRSLPFAAAPRRVVARMNGLRVFALVALHGACRAQDFEDAAGAAGATRESGHIPLPATRVMASATAGTAPPAAPEQPWRQTCTRRTLSSLPPTSVRAQESLMMYGWSWWWLWMVFLLVWMVPTGSPFKVSTM
jgi:hypothetical protein